MGFCGDSEFPPLPSLLTVRQFVTLQAHPQSSTLYIHQNLTSPVSDCWLTVFITTHQASLKGQVVLT